jgi:hypothetical protein
MYARFLVALSNALKIFFDVLTRFFDVKQCFNKISGVKQYLNKIFLLKQYFNDMKSLGLFAVVQLH